MNSKSDEDAESLLSIALHSMDQGLIVVRGDLTVPILNVRATELADCPSSFAENPPTFPEILAYQVKIGAITHAYMESSINRFILDGEKIKENHRYTRKTNTNRWLDVRTTPLPDGGFVRTFTDQTEWYEISAAKRQSDNAYRALFENSAVGIYRSSADGTPQRMNPELVSMHRYHSEEDALRHADDIANNSYVDPERRKQFHDVMRKDGRVIDFESEIYRHLTKEKIWISETAWAVRDADDEFIGYEGTIIDVTERKHLEALITYAAHHDTLTELPNRARFNQAVEEALLAGDKFSLVYLDLDGFKAVNDTYGHQSGDGLLISFAKLLDDKIGANGTVFRIGGDEFAVITSNVAADFDYPEELLGIPLSFPLAIDDTGRSVKTSISGGAVEFPRDATNLLDLLKCADLALYAAKASGKSVICEYEKSMGDTLEARLLLSEEFHHALSNSQIEPYYQPIVDLRTGHIQGFEALARWHHPTRGTLKPKSFQDMLDDFEVSSLIGEQIIKKVLADMAAWQRAGIGFSRVAINVGDSDLMRPNFATNLLEQLKTRGLENTSLEIEVTENCIFGPNKEQLIEQLNILRAAGCKVALDDFGTGQSSITRIKDLPITALKVDKSFVDDVLDNEKDQAIIKSLIGLGKMLSFHLVVEGVETQEQREILLEMGCEVAQGFHFSEAVPAHDIAGLIQQQT